MCIPNYSEGRDLKKVEQITECFRAKENIKLIDYQPDADHNRLVVEVIGEPEAVINAVIESVKVATEIIDMSQHKGAHPRYEDAASTPDRKNLAKVRKGQYEGFFDKIKEPEWKPDFGPKEMNVKSGATAVAARFHLIAFNVNLNTSDLTVADTIAKKVRHIGGGLRFVKAIGLELEEKGQTQVSMNLVNFEKTAIYQALEMIKSEAKRYGVTVVNTELIGLLPLQALVDSAAYYMQIEGLKSEQVLETLLIEE